MQSLFHGTTQGGLAVRLEGELNIDHLHKALRRTVQDFEILSCVIEENEQGLVFAQKTEAALPITVVRRQKDDDWREALRTLNDQPLAADRELWRLVVLTPSGDEPEPFYDLLLFVHHAIMDGTAADTFLDRLLSYCSQLPDSGCETPGRPLPPAAETALPASMQMGWEPFVAWQRESQSRMPSLPPLPHKLALPLEERSTAFTTLHLDVPQSSALAEYAKSQGVTLNSLLSAALLLAVHSQTPTRSQLALYTTFSLRRLCAAQIDEHDIGCCMTVLATVHSLPPPALEALAQEHQQELARAVMRQTKVPSSVDTSALREAMAPLRQLGHFASDIGFTFGESRLKPGYGSLRIRHFYPTVNRALGNLALAVHGVRLNGELFLTLNHTVPLQDDNWAAKVAQAFSDIVCSKAAR